MKIRVQSFKGSFPRVHPTRLAEDSASVCASADTRSGVLKPMHDMSAALTLPDFGAVINGAHLWRTGGTDYWLQFRDAVHVIRSPIADDQYRRIYWSGDSRDVDGHVLFSYTPAIYGGGGSYPAVWFKLGIPAPSTKPTIISSSTAWGSAAAWSASQVITKGAYIKPTAPNLYVYLCTVAGTTGTTEPTWPTAHGESKVDGSVTWQAVSLESFNSLSEDARVYFYTLIGKLGEESAPSPASDLVVIPHESATVVVGGLLVDAATATGREIVATRLYRSVVDSSGRAIALFVGEIPVAQNQYADSINGSSLAGELVTTTWDDPRTGMLGLGLTAYGVAYGYQGKIVCLSEPFVPYAWPRNYELTTQYDIVAIGHYDSYVIVATKGNPVVIAGIDPSSTSMLELPIMEACVSAKSMVSMGHSAIYASPNGLVMASGSTAQLVTDGLFGPDEWAALNPSSIHAVEHRGRYLFFWYRDFNHKGAYLLDPRDLSRGLISIDQWCKATHRDLETDTLYLLQEGGVLVKFDDPAAHLASMVWRSKVFVSSDPVRMLAAQVIADSYGDTTCRVYANGELLYTRAVTDWKPFRLPNHSTKREWQIEIQGTDQVREIAIGETMREMLT